MKKLLVVSAVAATSLMASGYKIPEQSLNSTALSGAYVSNTSAADAAYYNPANMAFMSSDKHLELNAMYIHLNPIEFSGSAGGAEEHTAESASEDFIIPQIYVVSAPLDENEDFRLGLSVNAPAGLSKRWPSGVESESAEEFTLKVIEVNPTLSYRILDDLAIAVGARFVYSEGVIKTEPNPSDPYQRQLDMEGDSWDLGYNLALSYKPFESWGVALTYRSNVDLTEEGGQNIDQPMYLPAKVTVPLPAVLTIATDVDVTDSTNIEFVYERAFWSAYDKLDISVDMRALAGAPLPGAGTIVHMQSNKDWEDTNTVRLGLTQELDDYFDVMLGVAYDETPVPDETIGFELPDSNAVILSGGLRWAVNDEFDVGAAVLYDVKEDRSVSGNDNGIDGTFSGSSAFLVSVGLGYKF